MISLCIASVCIHRRDQANINGLYSLTRPKRRAYAKCGGKNNIWKRGTALYGLYRDDQTNGKKKPMELFFSPLCCKLFRDFIFLPSIVCCSGISFGFMGDPVLFLRIRCNFTKTIGEASNKYRYLGNFRKSYFPSLFAS